MQYDLWGVLPCFYPGTTIEVFSLSKTQLHQEISSLASHDRTETEHDEDEQQAAKLPNLKAVARGRYRRS